MEVAEHCPRLLPKRSDSGNLSQICAIQYKIEKITISSNGEYCQVFKLSIRLCKHRLRNQGSIYLAKLSNNLESAK